MGGRNYYAKYPERCKERVKERRARSRAVINEAKRGQPCVDCGIPYPPLMMHFHHVRGTKQFNISDPRALGLSLKKLYAELKKCILLCATCHRTRTDAARGRRVVSP